MSAPTNHILNWLRPSQMLCTVSAVNRTPVRDIALATCGRCVLRVLRTGQALGLDVDEFTYWKLEDIEARWTPELAGAHRQRASED